MRTLCRRLWRWCVWIGHAVRDWLRRLVMPSTRTCRWIFPGHRPTTCRRVFAQPKPKWVKTEIIRLKALMPQAGCRTIAHHFNRRWAARQSMTVSKTYVADTLSAPPVSHPHSASEIRASGAEAHAAQSGMGLRFAGEDGQRGTSPRRTSHSRSCEPGLPQIAAAVGNLHGCCCRN
jgi:hypothetical protein